MSYSYETMGGGSRSLANQSNVWFYPRIRVVPQSEYSYWGITETDGLVFDTYFFSNSTWSNGGGLKEDLVTSGTQLPKKVYYIDETTNTTKEAEAIGFSPEGSWYQSVWIKPAVVKCITSKGYITSITCNVARSSSQEYYMGVHPTSPVDVSEVEDDFLPDEETSETLKWRYTHTYNGTDCADGSFNDTYYYFKKYPESTSFETVTYFLWRSCDKIYNYRKFYFIVPIGCQISFGIQALDFWAYGGWDNLSCQSDLILAKDFLFNDDYITFRKGYNNLKKVGYEWDISRGNLISNKMTLAGTTASCCTDRGTSTNNKAWYVSGQTSYAYGWEVAISNPVTLVGLNTSTGSYTSLKDYSPEFEVREDNSLLDYYNFYSSTIVSGTKKNIINFGSPQLRYAWAGGKKTGYNTYYAYLNKNCISSCGCSLSYKDNQLSGMDGTTIADNISISSDVLGKSTLSGSITVTNNHDSTGQYKIRAYNSVNVACDGSTVTIPAFSSATLTPYSSDLGIDYTYTYEVMCTYISETAVEIIPHTATISNKRTMISIDSRYNSSYYSASQIYYFGNVYYITKNNTATSTFSCNKILYNDPSKIVAKGKSYWHQRGIAYRTGYSIYNGSWTTTRGDYSYDPTVFSSETGSYYKSTPDITINTKDWRSDQIHYGAYFFVDSYTLDAPTIVSSSNSGYDKQMSIKNNNPIALDLYYGYFKRKTSANGQDCTTVWVSAGSLASGGTTTITFYDQPGLDDYICQVGFMLGNKSNYYIWRCRAVNDGDNSIHYDQYGKKQTDSNYTFDMSYYASNKAPVIARCEDGTWYKRKVYVYNPNSSSMSITYSSKKSNSMNSFTNGSATTTIAGFSIVCLPIIEDVGGTSDKYIVVYGNNTYVNIKEDDMSYFPTVL